MIKRRLVATGAVGVLLLLVGCKPKVGGSCAAGQSDCADPKTALTCGKDGKYLAMPCRGDKGCVKTGAKAECDNGIAQEKDVCDEENDVACAVDKKAALECHGGTFGVGETCKGPHGCEIKGDKITCDNDISDVDDPCHFEGDYACTSDKLYVLKCIDHKMKKLNSCRGAKSCRVFELPAEHKIEFVCDDTIAQAGDPCDEENEVACTMDKKAILQCHSAVFAALKDCKGPKGCTFDDKGEKFECDPGAGGTGKPVDVKEPTPPGTAQKPAGKKK
jgi:hypothetical protein